MSIYSNSRRRLADRTLPAPSDGVRIVHAVEPQGVLAVSAGERFHRVHVVERVVVMPDRVAHVRRRPVVDEVVGGTEYSVMWVVHVPTQTESTTGVQQEQ